MFDSEKKADFLFAEGFYDEALLFYRRSTVCTEDRVALCVKMGNCCVATAHFEQAMSCYNHALRLDPKSHYAYYNRGLLYRFQGRFAEAVKDYSMALSLDPSFVAAYLNRGTVYLKLLQCQLAVADYSAAIELDQSCAEAYHNRGLARLEMGELDLAVADVARALCLKQQRENSV